MKMKDLSDSYSELTNPDKFAEIFCAAAKAHKGIDSVLKDVLVDLLRTDKDAQSYIKKIVVEVDRGYGRILTGRLGFGIWTIIMLLFGELVRYFLKT